MPYRLEDLIIDRVDLVDEGANSAAFIELYKRKEQSDTMDVNEIISKMKAEHAEVIKEAIEKMSADLAKAQEATATALEEHKAIEQKYAKALEDLKAAEQECSKLRNEPCDCDGDADDDGMCKVCGKPKKKAKEGASFDETIKGMPEAVKALFTKMKAQKDAAEAELLKAKDAEQTAAAIAKANELKALPIEQDKLVGIVKSASADVIDLLTVVNAAIDGAVLGEVGKSGAAKSDNSDAWAKIEAKADEISKRDSITKAKAISVVIKEEPVLYKEYLQGGAN